MLADDTRRILQHINAAIRLIEINTEMGAILRAFPDIVPAAPPPVIDELHDRPRRPRGRPRTRSMKGHP